jgi:hypothetical protein
MSFKVNAPNKSAFVASNVAPYAFPSDGNDTEVVTRGQNQDIYSYDQYYLNANNMFGGATLGYIQDLSLNYIAPNQPFMGAVLAPNGIIYTTPYTSDTNVLLAMDTYTDRFTTIPLPDSQRFIGGVCLPNGKIYRISFNVQIQDTNNNTFRTVTINYGSLAGGYQGCVLGPNGKIYGVPGVANNVLVFNPEDESYKFLTSSADISEGFDRKWFGGALAPNGKIYCFPQRFATKILVIDTNNDTISSIGSIIADPNTQGYYWGGCLAQNGKIYAAPTNSGLDPSAGRYFLEIDPSLNTYNYVGALQSGTRKYSGPCLAPDGWIYCACDNSPDCIRFNPNTYAIQNLGIQNRRYSCSLGPNGKVYFPPRQGPSPSERNAFYIVKTGYPTLQPWMMAPEFNKF